MTTRDDGARRGCESKLSTPSWAHVINQATLLHVRPGFLSLRGRKIGFEHLNWC